MNFNELDYISLTATDIQNQISKMSLKFPKEKDDEVENHLKFPMFVDPFYDFIKTEQKLPTQEEFWLYYCKKNVDYLESLNLIKPKKDALKARIYRTYPSLIRDIHFACLLRDSKLFSTVMYNRDYDYKYGIDLILVKDNKTIGLNLFTDTRRAQHARTLKLYRPKKPVTFQCYDIPISLNTNNKLGDFYLYNEEHIKYILEKIFQK